MCVQLLAVVTFGEGGGICAELAPRHDKPHIHPLSAKMTTSSLCVSDNETETERNEVSSPVDWCAGQNSFQNRREVVVDGGPSTFSYK